MSHAHATTVIRGFGQTERRDTWWATPLAVFLGFSTFIVYATWAAFQGEHYTHGPYLSPFYSPEIYGNSPHSWLGPFPSWWPAFLPASPALLILPIPGGFRFTCYYYRGAYYKAFWADPPACAVGEPRTGYRGEHKFPLILQNAHRYVLFLTLAVLAVLAWDVWLAMWFTAPTGSAGTASASARWCSRQRGAPRIRAGCHSLRHVGRGAASAVDKPIRQERAPLLELPQSRHMLWGLAEPVLGRPLGSLRPPRSMGVISDWRLF